MKHSNLDIDNYKQYEPHFSNFTKLKKNNYKSNTRLNNELNSYKMKVSHLETYIDTLLNDKRNLEEQIKQMDLDYKEQNIQFQELKNKLQKSPSSDNISIIFMESEYIEQDHDKKNENKSSILDMIYYCFQ